MPLEFYYNINMLVIDIKNYQFIQTLKKFNVIHDYKLLKKNDFNYIKITLFFYKNKIICHNFKLISNQSKIFTISYHSLKLLTKKSGSSIFLISTSNGLLSSKEAINQRIGGVLLGFFSL